MKTKCDPKIMPCRYSFGRSCVYCGHEQPLTLKAAKDRIKELEQVQREDETRVLDAREALEDASNYFESLTKLGPWELPHEAYMLAQRVNAVLGGL